MAFWLWPRSVVFSNSWGRRVLSWLDAFSRFIVRISGAGAESAVSRLDPALAAAGGAVALEVARRALLELSRPPVDIVRRRLSGEAATYASTEPVRQLEHFVESLSLETLDLGAFEQRLVRICHALDHLNRLQFDLIDRPPVGVDFPPAPSFTASAQALEATSSMRPATRARPLDRRLSRQSGMLRIWSRGLHELLEDVALPRVSTRTARNVLEALSCADGAVYHVWRLAESLRSAASGDITVAARRAQQELSDETKGI